MIYIGIDPGKNGAYAVIKTECGKITNTFVKPWNDREFADCMSNACTAKNDERVVACVEKVGAMPGQGVTSMFSFGKSAGFIEGVLTAYGIGYQLIPPKRWKKEYCLSSLKQKSIDVCRNLFPDVSLKRTDRCSTNHDGMAEALLMAEYARRHL